MTVSTLWDEFRTVFLPENAPDIQVRQLKNAFYAGAASLLHEISGGPTADKPPTRAEMIKTIQAAYVDVNEFALDAKFQ